MGTRLLASQRTREELTALIEGRLSTALTKDELGKLAKYRKKTLLGQKMRNFLGHKFWVRGYVVPTVGRDQGIIRSYIRKQEMADKQLEHMQLKLVSL